MRAETDAAVARLNTVGASRVYREGEVPDNPTTAYFVVSTGVGTGTNYRRGAVASSRRQRLVVRFFGLNYTETAWAAEKAQQAFEGHRLTATASPCRLEVDTALDLEDPLLGGLHTYTYLS